MRRVQVPEEEVRARVHIRPLLRLGARGGALRGGAQGVRREQRVEAPPPHPRPQAARRSGHDMLRGAGPTPGPHLRLRGPHLRPPATGTRPRRPNHLKISYFHRRSHRKFLLFLLIIRHL